MRKPDKKGWDAADALEDGWTQEDIVALFRATVTEYQPTGAPPLEPEPDPNVVDMNTRKPRKKKPEPVTYMIGLDGGAQPADDADWMQHLVLTDEFKPRAKSVQNAYLYIRHHPSLAGKLGYNTFTDQVVWSQPPGWRSERVDETLTDQDVLDVMRLLEINHVGGLGQTAVQDIIVRVAMEAPFDPVVDFLDGLKWDGKPRLDKWLSYYLGAPHDGYTAAVGRRFMIGAVARALRPGCKMDTMLILEGRQGIMKSTAIRTLFAPWFTDELHNLDSKDSQMQIQGVWGVEMSELSAMSKSESNRIKDWLTRTVDRYRPPYGRNLIERPRRCVLVGSVNPAGGYLRDATGGRRFWPVQCVRIDIQALTADRDQLWAEAVHAYRSGEPWHLSADEEELARLEQSDRHEGFAWDAELDEYAGTVASIVPSNFLSHLGIPKEAWPRHFATVKQMLIARGYTKKKKRDPESRQPRDVYEKEGGVGAVPELDV